MKVNQTASLPHHLIDEAVRIGAKVARLRVARGMKQTEAALRAGISRNTAYRIERGDPGLAMGQLLRYVDAIASGTTLLHLLTEDDPALTRQQRHEQRQRVRGLTQAELDDLNF
ncbi:helix-turn-helix domain-containing protein [Roseateles amylovorans]|uniref:Helix-turn-helix domain-containing protein n=1 Tax=Roseateles amylovorans TaxID=2978473 RepID=A0ABY6AZ95_9BURK|nr:helix-turn-helix transcriptional regulator [Roseateles amylovorans]UXH78491.1 helix-turn-helix domain-containing protein [Roseateles amylovorans]